MLDSPDQGAKGIPISVAERRRAELRDQLVSRFTGTMRKDGTTFDGQFQQAGARMPLMLRRDRQGRRAALKTQTPKPPFPYQNEDVTYEEPAGGVTLAGTLTIPQGKGPFPRRS